MAEVITIRGKWTVETLTQEFLLIKPQYDKKYFRDRIPGVLFGLFLSSLFLWGSLRGHSPGKLISIIGFSSFVIFILLVPCWSYIRDGLFPKYSARCRAKSQMDYERIEPAEIVYKLHEDRLDIAYDSIPPEEAPLQWRNQGWGTFDYCQIFPDGIFLFSTLTNYSRYIPRSWVSDEAAWQSILSFVTEKVPASPPAP